MCVNKSNTDFMCPHAIYLLVDCVTIPKWNLNYVIFAYIYIYLKWLQLDVNNIGALLEGNCRYYRKPLV